MKNPGMYFFLICVGIACISMIASGIGGPNYKVGQCLVMEGNDSLYKVIEVGQYGLKTVKPRYDGYEHVYLDPNDLKKATRMDCFDLFDLLEGKK